MTPRALVALGGLGNSRSKSLFKKAPGDMTGRQVLGNAADTRRIEGGQIMRKSAINPMATTFVSATTVVPITEEVAARRFAAVVHRIDAGTLASAAKRTKEAAKMWKAGRRCPNGSSLINMASNLDVVWEWLQGEVEARRPSSANDVIALLHQKAMMPGQEGAEARAVLAAISRATSA